MAMRGAEEQTQPTSQGLHPHCQGDKQVRSEASNGNLGTATLMGSSINRPTVTVNHQKGKSLNIKSNICGGLELDVNHTPNSLGSRTINVLATKAGARCSSTTCSSTTATPPWLSTPPCIVTGGTIQGRSARLFPVVGAGPSPGQQLTHLNL